MPASSTVGILYPGELGAALGKLLLRRGFRVVTAPNGRSERTARLTRDAGLEILDSPADVIRQSHVMISCVPPAAAEVIADQYLELADSCPADSIYMDVNSIGPETAVSLSGQIESRGRKFVDASIHGQASNLAGGATLYLSGAAAGRIASLIGDAMRVRLLGPQPGRASAMKMMLAGLSKGMCALFIEAAMLARREEMFTEFNEEASQFYSGLVSAVGRMLPTYPQHVVRRIDEVRQLEQTSRAIGQEPCMFSAVRRILEELARVPLSVSPNTQWAVPALVEKLIENEFLSGPMPVEQSSIH